MSYEVVNIEVMPDGTWKKINPTNDDASKRISELEARLAAAQAEAERLAEELNLTNGEIKGWRMRYSQVG